jgi:hypothetical protein
VSVEDDKCSGQQRTSKTTENVEKIREHIHEEHRWAIHELTDTDGISYAVCQEIFNRKSEHAPHCRKVCSPDS